MPSQRPRMGGHLRPERRCVPAIALQRPPPGDAACPPRRREEEEAPRHMHANNTTTDDRRRRRPAAPTPRPSCALGCRLAAARAVAAARLTPQATLPLRAAAASRASLPRSGELRVVVLLPLERPRLRPSGQALLEPPPPPAQHVPHVPLVPSDLLQEHVRRHLPCTQAGSGGARGRFTGRTTGKRSPPRAKRRSEGARSGASWRRRGEGEERGRRRARLREIFPLGKPGWGSRAPPSKSPKMTPREPWRAACGSGRGGAWDCVRPPGREFTLQRSRLELCRRAAGARARARRCSLK